MLRLKSVRLKSPRSRRLVLALVDDAAADDAEPREMELAAEVYASGGIGVGDRLTAKQLDELRAQDDRHRCRERAWSLIARRPRSRAELRRALRERRFSAPLIESILDDLESKGHLDDTAFARQAVDQALSAKRAGPRLVRRKLAEKGVAPAIADAALGPIADREHQREAARAILLKWNRRSSPADPVKRSNAATAFLLRRGFDMSVARALVREIVGRSNDDSEFPD